MICPPISCHFRVVHFVGLGHLQLGYCLFGYRYFQHSLFAPSLLRVFALIPCFPDLSPIQSNSNCAKYFSRSTSVTGLFMFSLSRIKFSSTSASMSVARKQRYASSGLHTIGSPRTL